MQIYLINLDRAGQRLTRITKLLHEEGVNFIRVPAIDGQKMTDAQYNAYTTPSEKFRAFVGRYCASHGRKNFLDLKEPTFDRILTKGELACFLSHRECLRCIAEGKERYGMVLEDDFALSHDAGYFFNNTDWIPEGVDMVKLDRWIDPCWVGREKKLKYGYSLRRLFTRNYAATGYIVTKECAKLLYDLTEYATLAIDVLYFDPDCGLLRYFNVQQFYPALLAQIGMDSCILDRAGREKKKLSRFQIFLRECERIKVKHRFLLRLLHFGRGRWGKVPFFRKDGGQIARQG